MNNRNLSLMGQVPVLSGVGVDFKQAFTPEFYRAFFADAGYLNVEIKVIDGRLPCAVAILAMPEDKKR